jgi:hypothetical protein
MGARRLQYFLTRPVTRAVFAPIRGARSAFPVSGSRLSTFNPLALIP